jgi:MFS family permease
MTLAMIAIAYLDRVCISTAAPAIKAELGLSDSQMGYVFSAFTLSYALFEVPAGWFADRYGARIALTRIVLWWSAMTAATGVVGGFTTLFAVRLLFGIGEAGAFPSSARVYAFWQPARLRGRLFGVLIMSAALAGAATQPLVVALLQRVGWRATFFAFGAVGVVWSIAWWLWFRDDPRDHKSVNAAELALLEEGGARSGGHVPVPWRELARNPTLIALCAMYVGAIYGWYFYLTWLPTYLLRARGFDLGQVGWLAALPLLAIAAGCFAGGWVVDHLSPRVGLRVAARLPGLVGLPLAACSAAGAALAADPIAAALLLAAAAGLAALGIAPAWTVCVEIGGPHAAVVSGAMNMFGNLGGTLSPVVVGISIGAWALGPAVYRIAALYLVAGAAGCSWTRPGGCRAPASFLRPAPWSKLAPWARVVGYPARRARRASRSSRWVAARSAPRLEAGDVAGLVLDVSSAARRARRAATCAPRRARPR